MGTFFTTKTLLFYSAICLSFLIKTVYSFRKIYTTIIANMSVLDDIAESSWKLGLMVCI